MVRLATGGSVEVRGRADKPYSRPAGGTRSGPGSCGGVPTGRRGLARRRSPSHPRAEAPSHLRAGAQPHVRQPACLKPGEGRRRANGAWGHIHASIGRDHRPPGVTSPHRRAARADSGIVGPSGAPHNHSPHSRCAGAPPRAGVPTGPRTARPTRHRPAHPPCPPAPRPGAPIRRDPSSARGPDLQQLQLGRRGKLVDLAACGAHRHRPADHVVVTQRTRRTRTRTRARRRMARAPGRRRRAARSR